MIQDEDYRTAVFGKTERTVGWEGDGEPAMIGLLRHCIRGNPQRTGMLDLKSLSHPFTLDAVAHCRSECEAQALLSAIGQRLRECKLEMHPEKSGVVYCKDDRRPQQYSRIQFTFLGYTFRPRRTMARNGKARTGFLPAVSAAAIKRMRRVIRQWRLPRQTSVGLHELARRYNPSLRGWLSYYGHFYKSAMRLVFDHFDRGLRHWARRKYRTFAHRPRRVRRWLQKMINRQPRLFIHWLAFGKLTVRTMGAV